MSPLRVLVVALAFASPALAAEGGKKYALLVGVKEYDHAALPNLKFPENDVESLAAVLTAKGADFAEVVVLTTARGKKDAALQPTAKNIRAYSKRLSGKVKKADLLIVGLSGHGLQMIVTDPATKKESDEPFFCPSDARPKAGQKRDDARLTMISLRELFRELDESGAGVRLMLVDACRNDPALPRSANLATDDLPKPAKGTAVLFSCKSGERAWETPKLGKGHGVFFHYVIEGLKGQAKKNTKGEVTWNALSDYVVEKVQDEVPTVIGGGATQTPHELRNIVGKSPVLVGEAGGLPEAERLFQEARAWLGGTGGQVDQRRAYILFTRSAELGHPVAAGEAAMMLYLGQGVEKDENQATSMIEAALPKIKAEAEKGVPEAMTLLGELFFDGIGTAKDEKQGTHLYKKAAEKGHFVAMNNLGYAYLNGKGVKQDEDEAERLLARAAEKGIAQAMNGLGNLYADSKGNKKDDEAAVRWYTKAADKGEANSMTALGVMYMQGSGFKKDDEEAVRWFEKAARKDNSSGMRILGFMYAEGRGVKKDNVEAVRWYKKAADKGDAIGMTNLGVMYAEGRGVKKDDVEAVRWYKKAADKGDVTSMSLLGFMNEDGRGVKKDYAEALHWYKKAADKGNTTAMNMLGFMYRFGRGVEKDYAEAIRWYSKAAYMGDPMGMHNVGSMYRYGRGFKKDYDEAIWWYKRAAAKGLASSMQQVGSMIENGEGTPQDKDAAVVWYKKAAALGNEAAKKRLAELGE